ncbi:hypothetical protein OKA05_07085 [Luteolibacter arcticus]|uniref:Entericidin A/B family lipoprotein n=1 Tax=Luteolibacter arcticus TaxID=1581411 RepID=A0ABT3GFD0_9BACT|nr:hypothetical protein [Luteolibacter arcticus]MCW1922312.1 hypothetical protein [Luteolibacter arcticus]
MKKLYAFAAFAALLTLNSCNTAIGFGRDLRLLGSGMENKAHGRTWSGQDQQQQENLPTY